MIKAVRTNRLPVVGKAFALGARDVTEWAADTTAEYAIEEAPERTGYLKSKIRSVWRNKHRKDAVSEAPYSVHVNNGTSRQAANPYWDRALSRVASEFSRKARVLVRARL